MGNDLHHQAVIDPRVPRALNILVQNMPALTNNFLCERCQRTLKGILSLSGSRLQCIRLAQASSFRQGRVRREAVLALVLLGYCQGQNLALAG